LPVSRVQRTAKAEAVGEGLKPGCLPDADHSSLSRVVVDVTIGILAYVRHESARWIVLHQLPPAIRKGVQRIRGHNCPLQFLLLARRQASTRSGLFDYDASLQNFHRCGVCSWILPSVWHLTECINVARQSSDHMIPKPLVVLEARPVAHELRVTTES